MPRIINAVDIISGSGSAGPATGPEHALTGAGMGASPNVGEGAHIDTVGGAAAGFPNPPLDPASTVANALKNHLNDPIRAHEAVAIGVGATPPLFSRHVAGALGELAGAVSPPPPTVGRAVNYMALSGIPDWGVLKMSDGVIGSTSSAYRTAGRTPQEVYPDYQITATPSMDFEFEDENKDPASDLLWNNINNDPWNATAGRAKAAGFTRGDEPSPIVRARTIYEDAGDPLKITVSGMVFPADRGVLALIHWPTRGDIDAFLVQSLTDRCWAALLLGQGIDTPCVSSVAEVPAGDGDPGGIFSLGRNEDDKYDPFVFPGRATGQYDLHELHTGISDVDNGELPAPYGNGSARSANSVVQGGGQVRLGTNPDAGVAPTTYGIPILGASVAAYDPAPAINGTISERAVGHAALPARYNFFRYRLPYLADYSEATGLKYTPRAQHNVVWAGEAARYFQVAENYSTSRLDVDYEAAGESYKLKKAGNYPNFGEDHWTWQIARYRQVFFADVEVGTSLGTLWLAHFKKEADFEAFVRDGVMPWDATNGYTLYGMTPVDNDFNSTGNLVNEDDGNPLDFGYGSRSYHSLRREVFPADTTTTPSIVTNEWDYLLNGTISVMWVSGVAYFTPVQAANGNSAFRWFFTLEAEDVFTAGYRVDDDTLTSGGSPAKLNSRNPAMLSIAGFSYEGEDTFVHGNWVLSPGVTYTPPAGLTDARGVRKQRLEFPITKLGSNGTGAFSATNGPQAADSLTVEIDGTGTNYITLSGDEETPAFLHGVMPVVHLRTLEESSSPSVLNRNGYGTLMPHVSGNTVLFHSSGFHLDGATPTGRFGNFLDGSFAYASLLTAEKDSREWFLDEVYRYNGFVLESEYSATLAGPGMADWGFEPIPVPVRAGADNGSTWNGMSWLQNVTHKATLPAGHLQVRGLFQRNPYYLDWLAEPFPSAGLLAYPNTNYSGGVYLPNNTELSALPGSPTQPNYSAYSGDRIYTRALDANFARSDNPEEQQGQPYVFLRIDGLDLEDFAYAAPNIGGLGATGIAVLIKIPGMTTWMDLGRLDGDGPSKQDNVLDGAGCRVSGPYTYTYVDADTGLVYSQVQAHVGPAASLAAGKHVGGTNYEVPVLVKVIMRSSGTQITRFDLGWQKSGTGTFSSGFFAGQRRGWSAHDVRGIHGIRVLRPSEAVELTQEMEAAKSALGISVL